MIRRDISELDIEFQKNNEEIIDIDDSRYLKEIEEIKKDLKAKCEKSRIPYEIIKLLIKEDIYSLEEVDFDVIRKNFFVLYRFTSIEEIKRNFDWLLHDPRENYAKIMTLKEEQIDMSELYMTDFEEDEMKETYEKELKLNPLKKEDIKKFEIIYMVMEKKKQPEKVEEKGMQRKK